MCFYFSLKFVENAKNVLKDYEKNVELGSKSVLQKIESIFFRFFVPLDNFRFGSQSYKRKLVLNKSKPVSTTEKTLACHLVCYDKEL